MDNLREFLNNIGPNIPFMMAGIGGDVKINTTEIAKLSIILLVLWLGFNDLKKEFRWLHSDYLTHKTKTEQKLEGIGRLEKRMDKIENVVFTPINDSEVIRRR